MIESFFFFSLPLFLHPEACIERICVICEGFAFKPIVALSAAKLVR